jgi:hypothetical protein
MSESLYVVGTKTESEFLYMYLDFIRKYGIPSTLQWNNAKCEMSQHVKKIHRGWIITDQWTEMHTPWQNNTELNDDKNLKSHAQILMYRTDASDNLWFLAQDYVTHVYNLSASY